MKSKFTSGKQKLKEKTKNIKKINKITHLFYNPNLKLDLLITIILCTKLSMDIPSISSISHNKKQTKIENKTELKPDTTYNSIFNKEYLIDTTANGINEILEDAIPTIQVLISESEGFLPTLYANGTLIGSGLSVFPKKGTVKNINDLYLSYENKNPEIKWTASKSSGYSNISLEMNLAAMIGYFRDKNHKTITKWGNLFANKTLKIGELSALCSIAYQSPTTGTKFAEYISKHHSDSIACAYFLTQQIQSFKQRRCLEALYYLNINNICNYSFNITSHATSRLPKSMCDKMIQGLKNKNLEPAKELASYIINYTKNNEQAITLEEKFLKLGLPKTSYTYKQLKTNENKVYLATINFKQLDTIKNSRL